MNAEDKARASKIAQLNDELRTNPLSAIDGRNMIVAAGELKSDMAMVARVMGAAAAFTDFNANDDPYGEHDFAAFEVDGFRCCFKIDYYDLNLECHSPDPADPEVTCRVLTLMFAADY